MAYTVVRESFMLRIFLALQYTNTHNLSLKKQVSKPKINIFGAEICQKTKQNKGSSNIKWLFLQNDKKALTTLLHQANVFT